MQNAEGARGQPRLLIVGDDPDIAELVAHVLTLEGYAVETVVGTADLVEVVRRSRPKLLVLDLGGGEDEERRYRQLDAIRADEQTARVPVLTLSTRESLAEGALTSYTVKASLAAPFELDDLLAAVRQALDEPPLAADLADAAPGHAPTDRAPAAQVLAAHSRAALFRWVMRLRREEPWLRHGELHLAQLLDSAPAMVEAVIATLRTGEPEHLLQEHPEVLERARAHAQTRRQQGIALPAVIRESQYLRNELWAIYRQALPPSCTAADVLRLEEVLTSSFDRVILETIEAYTGEKAGSGERPADA